MPMTLLEHQIGSLTRYSIQKNQRPNFWSARHRVCGGWERRLPVVRSLTEMGSDFSRSAHAAHYNGNRRRRDSARQNHSCCAISFSLYRFITGRLASGLEIARKEKKEEKIFRSALKRTFSCFLLKGQMEHVELLVPSVVLKNRAVNLTAVLRPSTVGTVTYYWWFGNKSEVNSAI